MKTIGFFHGEKLQHGRQSHRKSSYSYMATVFFFFFSGIIFQFATCAAGQVFPGSWQTLMKYSQ